MMKQVIVCLMILTAANVVVDAQIKIDLKTRFDEKQGLAYIKAAAKSSLGSSNLFVIKEFGERYSVWIHSAQQRITAKGLEVAFYVDLRTPANLSEGQVLKQRIIHYQMVAGQDYSALDTLGVSADNLFMRSLVPLAKNGINLAANTLLIPATGGMSIVANQAGIQPSMLLGDLLENLVKPSTAERRSAILASIYIATAVHEMVVEQESQK